jgi:flagellar hook-basal body complex protein FliE
MSLSEQASEQKLAGNKTKKFSVLFAAKEEAPLSLSLVIQIRAKMFPF